MKNSNITLAVCGLHLKGFPLHHQLTEYNAVYLGTAHTAPCYRLYALDTVPSKPGLVRVHDQGEKIEVELYQLSPESLGLFLCQIPSPLGLGKAELENGSVVVSFICEPYALEGAKDISSFGGWRYYSNATPS